MNLGKLIKRLRRDLLANPKKAALLGLMVLVACYFWAPLIGGALGIGKGGTTSAAAAAPVDLPNVTGDATQPAAKQGKILRWDLVQSSIAADALMASARFDSNWRDPFAPFLAPPKVVVEKEPSEPVLPPVSPDLADSPPPTLPAITPSEAGLVLQGVLIGPRGRAATINGEVYRVGELVPTSRDLSAAPFKIVQVRRSAVQLEANGLKHWLEFVKPKLAQGDEFFPAE